MRRGSFLAGVCVAVSAVLALSCNSDHSSPTEPLPSSMVTVEVAATCAAVTGEVAIALDGHGMGTVAPGSAREISVEGRGEHRVRLTPSLGAAATFDSVFDVESGGQRFRVHMGCEGGGAHVTTTRG